MFYFNLFFFIFIRLLLWLLLLFVVAADVTIVSLSTAQATNHDTNQIVNSNKMERILLLSHVKKMGKKAV